MAGQTVAVINTALLSKLLGERVEVRKSAREGAKYPLYLSTCCGPLHLNTRAGQDFLLEHAAFSSPDNPHPKPLPATPEPAPQAEPYTAKPRPHKPVRAGGFLENLFGGSDEDFI